MLNQFKTYLMNDHEKEISHNRMIETITSCIALCDISGENSKQTIKLKLKGLIDEQQKQQPQNQVR
jgi:hypothetical protein